MTSPNCLDEVNHAGVYERHGAHCGEKWRHLWDAKIIQLNWLKNAALPKC